MTVRVKICGNRTPSDVALAAEAGADAVGFVVASPGSRREVAPARAAELARRAPPFVQTVLVTRETNPARLAALQGVVEAQAMQIHGVRTEREARAVRRALRGPLLLAVGVGPHRPALALARALAPHADALVLDTPRGGRTGGTGEVHDWRVSARLARGTRVPVVLAGGLTPANVRGAIDAVRPFAVDVASGVGGPGGARSARRVRAFVEEVRSVG